jgi:hypothetical protein
VDGVAPVVLSGAGGFAESTIPEPPVVVDGVGIASRGTEFVVGICEAVGVVFRLLPRMLLAG